MVKNIEIIRLKNQNQFLIGGVIYRVSEFVDNYCSTGFNTFETENPSEYLLANKDRLIASEVERYYGIAKQILIENREFLDAVIEALVDHRIVTYREMQALRQKYVDCPPLGAYGKA